MAASNALELALKLKAAVDGIDQVVGLANEIEGLGGDATKVKAQAGALADELSTLARQGSVIEAFKQVSGEAEKAKTQFADLQRQAAEVGSQQKTLRGNIEVATLALDAQRRATSDLSAVLERTDVEVRQSQASLQDLAERARGAAETARQFASVEASTAAETRAATSALNSSETALQRNQRSIATLEAQLETARNAQRDLTNQVIAAEDPSDALTARHEKATERVEQLSTQLLIARTRNQDLTSAVRAAASAVADSQSQYQQASEAARLAAEASSAVKVQIAAEREELSRRRAALIETRQALADSASSERELQRAVRDDEAAIAKQTATLTNLERELERAEEAHRQQTEQVERASRALRYAGIDADNLAKEEQRVTRETVNAKVAVAELSQRLEQERTALRGTASDADKAAGSTKRFHDEQSAGTGKASKLGVVLGDLRTKVGGLVAAYFGFQQVKNLIEDVLSTGDRFEIYQKQLAGAFGSAAAGQQAFAWVKQFAKDTPLELDQVLEAVIQLKNFGLDPMDGTLQALVDQNARLGGSYERLQRIITATGQAYAKGRLQGEELLQFAEAGVPVFDLLSKKLGLTTEEVIKFASEGKLGRDVIKQLVDAIGATTVGAAADQMGTLTGRVSNAKDAYQQFLNQVANNGPLKLAKDAAGDLGGSLGDADDSARVLGQTITSVGEVLLSLMSFLRGFGLSVKLIFDGLSATAAQAMSIITLGISKITFGPMSENFRQVSADLQAQSRELAERFVEDGVRIQDAGIAGFEHLGNSGVAAYEAFRAAQGQAVEETKAGADQQAAASAKAAGAVQGVADAHANVAAQAAAAGAAGVSAGAQIVAGASKAEEAAKKLGLELEKISNSNTQDTDDQARAYEELLKSGQLTASGLKTAFRTAFDSADSIAKLDALKSAIERSYAAGTLGVTAYHQQIAKVDEAIGRLVDEQATGIDQVRALLQKAGLDYDELANRIRPVGRAAIDSFGQAVKAAREGEVSASRLDQAFQAALAQLKNGAELEALRQQLRGVNVAGFDAAAAIASIDEQLKKLPESSSVAALQVRKALETYAQMDAELDAQRQGRAQSTSQSIGEANAELDALRQKILNATDTTAVQNLRSEINKAYGTGKIASEEYQATVELAKEQTDQLAESTRGNYDALFGLIGGLRQSYAEVSDAAAKAFDEINDRASRHGITVNRYLSEIRAGVLVLNETYARQSTQADELIGRLGNVETATLNDVRAAEGAIRSFKFLDQTRLTTLQQQIDAVRGRLEQLRDSAKSTVSSLRDELDQLHGDQDAIDARRDAQRKAEIEAQLAEARKIGDRDSVRELTESLRLLEQIGKERASQRAAEEAGAQTDATRSTQPGSPSAPSTGGTTSTPAATPSTGGVAPRPTRTVRVEFTDKAGRTHGLFGEESSADAFVSQLERSAGVRGS